MYHTIHRGNLAKLFTIISFRIFSRNRPYGLLAEKCISCICLIRFHLYRLDFFPSSAFVHVVRGEIFYVPALFFFPWICGLGTQGHITQFSVTYTILTDLV